MSRELNALDPILRERFLKVGNRFHRLRNLRLLTRAALFSALLILVGTILLTVVSDLSWLRNSCLLLLMGAELILLVRLLFKPMTERVSAQQLALLIEKHYPGLDSRLVTLISAADPAADASPEQRWMIEKFTRESNDFLKKSRFAWEEPWYLPAFKPVPLIFYALVCLALPLSFPHLWLPGTGNGPAVQGLFTVEPGDATLRPGEDQTIFVRSALTDKAVSIKWRTATGDWTSEAMRVGDSDQIHYHPFTNLTQPIRYQIQFGPWRSPVYNLNLWIPPEVTAIDLVYRYPAYVDLPPSEIPNGGAINALEGTRVEVRAHVNKPLQSAEMVLESGKTLNMTAENDLLWSCGLELDQNDAYRLLLRDRDGQASVLNPQYEIAVQKDLPPKVSLEFPRGDLEVSALDEIDFAFSVRDDFGIHAFGLTYSIAGAEPVRISLKNPGTAADLNGSGRYHLALEELDLRAGDLLTWSVWAQDQKPGRAEWEPLGEPFFMEIRPFKRQFREAVSNQQAMPSGPQPPDPIGRQKEILIATWNLRKNMPDLDLAVYRERRDTILQSQEENRQVVQQLLKHRGKRDDLSRDLDAALDGSLEALTAAVPPSQEALTQATVHQQTAFALLLKLEPLLAEVSRTRNQRGQAEASQRRQLAGMDELEMKKNRNFYEDEKRTQAQQQAAEQALEKIKELAQRQQTLNNEIAKLISEMEQQQDPEEIKRRLDSLREEARKNLEQLDRMQRQISEGGMDRETSGQAQQDLRQVREQMNRELEHLEKDQLQQARAEGSRAVSQLKEIEEQLRRQAGGSAEERVEKLQERLRQLQEQAEAISRKTKELKDQKESPKLDPDDPSHEAKNQLVEDKREFVEQFKQMMEGAADVAHLTRQSQELFSRELGDWLRRTSKQGISEDMEESGRLTQYGIWEDAIQKEGEVREKLQQASQSLAQVAEQLVNGEADAKQKAHQQISPLIDGLTSDPDAQTPKAMGEFAEKGYRDWLNRVRNAETLLPPRDAARQQLTAIRREIEKIRRDFRQRDLVPRFELFLQNVAQPLQDVVHQLELDIQHLKRERQFVLQDDGSIPDQYKKRVADYFQALSESEEEP